MTQTYNEDVIINDNLEVNGASDEVQVTVKAASTQTEALQEWKSNGGAVLSAIDEEGHLLVGDQDGTIDALIEAHNDEDSNKPARGFHAKGILTGTLSSLVSWAVQELGLKGTGGMSALHRALRVQATNENTGAMAAGADVRAGDFEAINTGGNSGTNNLEMSALVAKVNNQSGAYLDKAYGLKVEMADDGNSNEVYAIHTDGGIVYLGDVLELEDNAVRGVLNTQARSIPPTNPVEGDRYLDDGTNTASHVVGERVYLSGSWFDIGDPGVGKPYLLAQHNFKFQDAGISLSIQPPSSYTVDQCTGGTVSASTYYSTNQPQEAFNNTPTSTNASDCWASNSTSTPHWLKYDFGSGNAKQIEKYTLVCQYNFTSRAPKTWELQGSNDNTNWTTVDSRSGISGWVNQVAKEFTFSNPNAYRYYRIYITLNNGDGRSAIGEMEMMEVATYTSLNDKLAQSFQVANTVKINKVLLLLKKVNSPSGDLTLRIETDNSGDPSSVLVDSNASKTLSETSLSTDYELVEFEFPAGFSLAGNTTYWLVFSTTRSASNSNYVVWGSDSNSGYSDGEMKSQSSGIWSTETQDAIFQIIGVGTVPAYVENQNLTASYSNSATSPIDVDTVNATLQITTLGYPVKIGLSGGRLGNSSSNNRINYIGFELDGSFYLGAMNATTNGITEEASPCNFERPVFLPAGTYTIKLQYYTSGDSVQLEGMDQAVFYAYELKP